MVTHVAANMDLAIGQIMDFQLSDEQRELQATARKFARAEMPKVAAQMGGARSIVQKRKYKRVWRVTTDAPC